MKRRILIVGAGDVAQRAIPWLVKRFRVYAVVRDPSARQALRALGATPLLADLDLPGSLRRLAGLADLVLHAAPPPSGGEADPRTQHLLTVLRRAKKSVPQALVYIGTTGVYGDCHGALVSESRSPAPSTPRARRRVAAEVAIRAFAASSGVRACVLRAPGIYAADRLSLERIERGDPVLRAEEDVYTNHIHADDLARAACLALFRGRPGRACNASDDSDLRMGDYFDLMADLFRLPRPPRVTREEAAARLSPLSLSFMTESRRLVNERLKRELRLRLRYPTVRDGLQAALAHPPFADPSPE